MKALMKKALAAVLLAVAAVTADAAELVERIVARVNDSLITQTSFDRRLAAARRARAEDPIADVRRDVLEDMIRERLLEDRAKELAVVASDEEVEVAVARVKAQYNLATDAEFDAALASSNMTRDDLKRQMRESITLQKVIGREVTSRVDMSDDALRLEYERQKEQLYAVAASATVAEIVLRFSPGDAESQAKAVAEAEEIRDRLLKGASFTEVAKQLSQGVTRDRGGELGTVSKGELVPALDAAVFSEPAQEYPPPAVGSEAVHVFRVTDRKAAGYKTFAEVKDDLRKRMSDELYERRFREYLDKLRRESFVKIYDPELAKAVAALEATS
jgi:parvulin-like peptidyl-prolyl isomerase